MKTILHIQEPFIVERSNSNIDVHYEETIEYSKTKINLEREIGGETEQERKIEIEKNIKIYRHNSNHERAYI